MGAKISSWWQYIRKHWIVALIIALVIAAMVLILVESLINGTGFNGYNQVTIAHTNSGPSAGTVVRTEVSQPGKTLWDWLQLLIIPIVIAVAGYVINLTISRGEQAATEQRAKSERDAAEKRAETEHEIALDNQREAALKEYIDKMSGLLLHEKLRESQPEDEVRTIARVQTLTTLFRLDDARKVTILQFLYESKLINKDKCVIALEGANLYKINLTNVNFSGANLSGAILRRATLGGANLCETNLSKTDFWGANFNVAIGGFEDLSTNSNGGILVFDSLISGVAANLSGANLNKAILYGSSITDEQLAKVKSLKGATMPDGSIHP